MGYLLKEEIKMVRTKTSMRRNKKGRYSETKSRSKQGWERGRGAKRKGNPRYKPVIRNGRKVYIRRKR